MNMKSKRTGMSTSAAAEEPLGKSVEITVREDVPAARKPDWKHLRRLAETIDFDEGSEKAFWELRRISTI